MENDLHHAQLLCKGYIRILFMVGVLLEKADPDDPGGLNHQLLIVGQHIGADQLDNLHQAALFLEQLGDLAAASEKILPDVFGIPDERSLKYSL